MLTALDHEETKLSALDLYAEDYILKPARYGEVVARIRSILRRTWLSCLPPSSVVRVNERLSLGFLRREARTPEGVFRLTPLESRFLQLLVQNVGHVVPNELILERLWGNRVGAASSYIVNEPALGYRFAIV